jgi:hypothetical protein
MTLVKPVLITGFVLFVSSAAGQIRMCEMPIASFDKASEVQLAGKFVELKEHMCDMGMICAHLQLRVDKEVVDVHLAPADFVKRSGFTFSDRDIMEVSALRVKAGSSEMILARWVRTPAGMLVLRDAAGKPKWPMGRISEVELN